MAKFVVSPHFRLQEWVAEQKGYFTAEGLDYEFREALDSRSGQGHQLGDKAMRAAYESLYDAKLWLKQRTVLGKLLISDDLSWL